MTVLRPMVTVAMAMAAEMSPCSNWLKMKLPVVSTPGGNRMTDATRSRMQTMKVVIHAATSAGRSRGSVMCQNTRQGLAPRLIC